MFSIKYDYDIQINIVGARSVGRTSLLFRFLQNNFEEDNFYFTKDIESKFLEFDNKMVRFIIFDIPTSSEVYGQTNQILSVNLRDSFGIIFYMI